MTSAGTDEFGHKWRPTLSYEDQFWGAGLGVFLTLWLFFLIVFACAKCVRMCVWERRARRAVATGQPAQGPGGCDVALGVTSHVSLALSTVFIILTLAITVSFERLHWAPGAIIIWIIGTWFLLHVNTYIGARTYSMLKSGDSARQVVGEEELQPHHGPDATTDPNHALQARTPYTTKLGCCGMTRVAVREYLREMRLKAWRRRWLMVVLSLVLVLGLSVMLVAVLWGACVTMNPNSFTTWASRRGASGPKCSENTVCNVYVTLGAAPTDLYVQFHSVGAPGHYYQPTVYYSLSPIPDNSASSLLAASSQQSAPSGSGSILPAVCTSVALSDLSEDRRTVHTAHLEPLQPDTLYYFVAAYRLNSATGPLKASEVLRLQTLPTAGTNTTTTAGAEVRFLAGGDIQHDGKGDALSKESLRMDPMFAMVGGDITYDNNIRRCYRRVDRFLTWWQTNMRRTSGALVPLLTSIGNHEAGGFHKNRDTLLFYLPLFTYEEQGRQTPWKNKPLCHSHVIARNLRILALDSGVVTPVEAQAQWIRAQLAAADAVGAATIPFYHTPAYPSVRSSVSTSDSVDVRSNWVPLFDAYPHVVRVAFENHDHYYKRTQRLRHHAVQTNQSEAAPGVTYIGDGSWGVCCSSTRKLSKDNEWYMAQTKNSNFVMWATWQPASRRLALQMYDAGPALIDSVTIPFPPSPSP